MAQRDESVIPIWKAGHEGLRNFLDQMENVQKLGLFTSEPHLIYTSLCNSNKQDIYMQLTKQEKSSIVEFAKFLHENYGLSMNEKKRRFNTLQQKTTESENEFFHRIILEYFQAKGVNRPNNSAFSDENKADITLAYISGLRNKELKRVVKLELDDCDDNYQKFFDLGKRTQRKGLSLKELETNVFGSSDHY